jgi:hypothetical protein
MPTPRESLKDRLARERQIEISVIGRKSGRKISMPVWFVMTGDNLYLLPVQGSDTQWYQNLIHNPSIGISARRGQETEFRAARITEPKKVSSVVGKFGQKYGARVVKKLYSKFDVAVVVKAG